MMFLAAPTDDWKQSLFCNPLVWQLHLNKTFIGLGHKSQTLLKLTFARDVHLTLLTEGHKRRLTK